MNISTSKLLPIVFVFVLILSITSACSAEEVPATATEEVPATATGEALATATEEAPATATEEAPATATGEALATATGEALATEEFDADAVLLLDLRRDVALRNVSVLYCTGNGTEDLFAARADGTFILSEEIQDSFKVGGGHCYFIPQEGDEYEVLEASESVNHYQFHEFEIFEFQPSENRPFIEVEVK